MSNVQSFVGRLTKDCEQRFTQAGKAICSFTVASDYGFGDNKGTNFFRCSLFGARAEGGLVQYLVKGTQVFITGELRIRQYDDKEGVKRTSVEVSVDKLDLIGGRDASSQASSQGGANNQQNQQQSGGASSDPFAGQPAMAQPVDDSQIPF